MTGQQELTFDGADYKPELDQHRLTSNYWKVWKFMSTGSWETLKSISQATGVPEASASALLRDFRKARNGSHTVNRHRAFIPESGLYEYQLLINRGNSD